MDLDLLKPAFSITCKLLLNLHIVKLLQYSAFVEHMIIMQAQFNNGALHMSTEYESNPNPPNTI